MRSEDKRASAAVLRREASRLRRLGRLRGAGKDERARAVADELETVAAGLEDEADDEDRELGARMEWAERVRASWADGEPF